MKVIIFLRAIQEKKLVDNKCGYRCNRFLTLYATCSQVFLHGNDDESTFKSTREDWMGVLDASYSFGRRVTGSERNLGGKQFTANCANCAQCGITS